MGEITFNKYGMHMIVSLGNVRRSYSSIKFPFLSYLYFILGDMMQKRAKKCLNDKNFIQEGVFYTIYQCFKFYGFFIIFHNFSISFINFPKISNYFPIFLYFL